MESKEGIYLKKIKEIIKKIYKKMYYICKSILKKVFLVLPIKRNKIIFDNFAGNGYADNPKYIADEFLRRNLNYDLVWLLNDMNQYVPDGIRKVKFGSIKSLYEYATAKVIVDNIRNAHLMKKKKGQLYLQTWHGTGIIKYIEKDAMDKLSDEYIKCAIYDGSVTDGIISNSKMQDDMFERAFWLGEYTEILKFGAPRNDIFSKQSEFKEINQKVMKYFGFNSDKYSILYAPTFRDNGKMDSYIKNFESIIKTFELKMGKECIIMIRLHPNEKDNTNEWKFNDKIVNASEYPDAQELVVFSDCLISDYSSIIYDFLFLKKTIFLYSKDIDEYKKIRGIANNYFELPFSRANSVEELNKYIENFDENIYAEKIEKYGEKYPIYDDGNATVNVVNWIIEKIKG